MQPKLKGKYFQGNYPKQSSRKRFWSKKREKNRSTTRSKDKPRFSTSVFPSSVADLASKKKNSETTNHPKKEEKHFKPFLHHDLYFFLDLTLIICSAIGGAVVIGFAQVRSLEVTKWHKREGRGVVWG